VSQIDQSARVSCALRRKLYHAHVVVMLRKLYHAHVVVMLRKLYHAHVVVMLRKLYHAHVVSDAKEVVSRARCGEHRRSKLITIGLCTVVPHCLSHVWKPVVQSKVVP
jgi:hypothetical protein